ncbi:MAG: hypothetical protein HZA15_12865 [Nitrospirae bacterium]|nr:hypothetical protein [Nitrospirota bacterium]
MINIVLLAAIFSPLLFLACFLFKKRHKLTFNLLIPAVISALFILFKAAQMSDFSAGGGDFKGLVYLTLPIIGFCAIAISYALWSGWLYLSRNWHNKKQRPGVAIIVVIMLASFATAFTYSDFLLYWPKGNSNPNRIRNVFWQGVFSGQIPAEVIRTRVKTADIVESEKAYVRSRLYDNDVDLDEAVLEILADTFKNDPIIPICIAAHRSTTEKMLRTFADSGPDAFLIGIATNPKTPPDLMIQIYRAKPAVVGEALYKNMNVPAQIFGEIHAEKAKDESIDLARKAEEQLRGKGEIYEPYRNQMNNVLMVRLCFYPIADTLSETRTELINDPRDYVRAWIAKCSGTPPEVLSLLSDDPSAKVLQWILLNENAPLKLKKKVSQILLKSMQAQNMHDQLIELADSRDVEMRTELARRNVSDGSILEKLSDDWDEDVRRAVAENKNITPDTLKKLSTDKSQYVRQIVAENRKTPLDILEKLSADSIENVREEVARNKKTPSEILRKLSNDNSQFVRQTVAENRKTPFDILEKLRRDDSMVVREAVPVKR